MNVLATLSADITRRRVVGTQDAAAFVGLSVSTFRRMKDARTIPAPIKLSERRIGWRIGDLFDYLDCRETGREWKDCQGTPAA